MSKHEHFGELSRLQGLEQRLSDPNEIVRIGDETSVSYRFPGEFFVKIPKHLNPHSYIKSGDSELSSSMVMNELLVTLMLLRRGYPVIEPYGLHEVTIPGRFLDSRRDIVAPAFVTRYKPGVVYVEGVDNGWTTEQEREMVKWISKAEGEGFEPGFDVEFGSNGLWVESEKRLYLIDFELWTGNEAEKKSVASSLGFDI